MLKQYHAIDVTSCFKYLGDIFGISLGYLWDIFGISWDILRTSRGCLWVIFGYLWDIFEFSLVYLGDMRRPECWFSVWVESTNLVTENIHINNSCQLKKNQQIVSKFDKWNTRKGLHVQVIFWTTVVMFPFTKVIIRAAKVVPSCHRGGRCSLFLTMRCFNDAIFSNS